MIDELAELYQQLLLDHSRSPRNRRRLDSPQRQAEGHNPLCGDHVFVFLNLEDERVRDVSFEGSGCAICTASASLMTEAVAGRSLQDVQVLFNDVHSMLTKADPPPAGRLGKLHALAGVRRFPLRVKCATLPWHTLMAAIRGGGAVSTE